MTRERTRDRGESPTRLPSRPPASPSGPEAEELPKSPTGIHGLDEITGGGLPLGRTTLISGGPGCGKTLFGIEFLVRGAMEYGEPGVLFSFEEQPHELAANVRSLGFDLDRLTAEGRLLIEYVHLERSEIEETGEYDLEGLFIRLGHAIDSIGARRVVVDTIETLFSGLSNHAILRAELRRLFRWLKEKGVTAVITCERGEGALTRHGLEEYVSDCVILLDHRVLDQLSTRRLRVVKYRGTAHGSDEHPFVIDRHGLSVLPITSLGLKHEASGERISTGIPRLDGMLSGRGIFRGSTVLVSGTAGTGKTSLAATFAEAACARGERCLYLAFEESPSQILRNMRSIGIDLEPRVREGTLRFHAARPTVFGMELHLVTIHRLVEEFDPAVTIMDPVSNLPSGGTLDTARSMLLRTVDFLKSRGITAFLTSLASATDIEAGTEIGISSLVDTWILLRDVERDGERNRTISVLKSRGMPHSNQLREFRLTGGGVELCDVSTGAGAALTGSARATQEARDRVESSARQEEGERRRRAMARRRKRLEARMAALNAELEAEEEEGARVMDLARRAEERESLDRIRLSRLRGADDAPAGESA